MSMEDVTLRIWFRFDMSQTISAVTRLLKVYDDLTGIRWKWHSLDSNSVEAPLDGKCQTGSNPTDGGKNSYEQNVIS